MYKKWELIFGPFSQLAYHVIKYLPALKFSAVPDVRLWASVSEIAYGHHPKMQAQLNLYVWKYDTYYETW
jgi:hypothetical protein